MDSIRGEKEKNFDMDENLKFIRRQREEHEQALRDRKRQQYENHPKVIDRRARYKLEIEALRPMIPDGRKLVAAAKLKNPRPSLLDPPALQTEERDLYRILDRAQMVIDDYIRQLERALNYVPKDEALHEWTMQSLVDNSPGAPLDGSEFLRNLPAKIAEHESRIKEMIERFAVGGIGSPAPVAFAPKPQLKREPETPPEKWDPRR